MELNRFWHGFLVALFMVGCAGASIHYYGLSGVRYDNGVLLGPDPKDDIPFNRCEPTEAVKNPCTVMFTGEFYKFKTDYEDCKTRLKQCEKGHSGSQTLE